MKGPLAPYASGFYADLIDQGYVPGSAERQMGLVSQVSQWMMEAGLRPCELTAEAVDRFLAGRRAQGRKIGISPAATAPLMNYLRRLAIAPEPRPSVPVSAGMDGLIEEYRIYLATRRGLAPGTIRGYLRVARLFLSEQSEAGGWKEPTAAEVSAFVVREVRGRRAGSAQHIVKGMRALLRFLHVDGKINKPLDQVVLGVASWRNSTLPKALEPSQVDRLLASCDQTTPKGQRDFAILTILVRLGLRAGEVAALRVSDIDWRRGEIVLQHGKANRVERLPLPTDVGQAIVAWLVQGRPAGSTHQVFTRVCAPYRGLTMPGVSDVVHNACLRAGLPPVHAHRLRHTAATQMLRSGANLAEIGQVLRHRNFQTTAIYAKVDRASLSALARPWPGAGL
jgi:integrase/recombinase XerD